MKKILVLYGGNSYEHDISCISVQNVCKCLKNLRLSFDKVYISRENKWFLVQDDGKSELLNIVDFLKKYAIVFPVLHGSFGEDGRIQAFFELFGINYLGSNSLSSAIAMNKYLTKLVIEKTGIQQIPYFVLNKSDAIPENVEFPVIIKPLNGGSSIGISIAHSNSELKKSLKEGFKYDQNVIVEKFINGIDLECGIVELNKLIVGDVGEIRHSHEFYDYDAKYNEDSEIIIPAGIDKHLREEIQEYALKIFKALNLKDFARIDFILDKEKGTIYFNEVNTIPGFTEKSMFPILFQNKKLDFTKIIDKLIKKSHVKWLFIVQQNKEYRQFYDYYS